MKERKRPEILRSLITRANELPLLCAVMLFQFACMLLLTFRDGGVNMFSLCMSVAMPLGTYLGLKLISACFPIDRALYILFAFLCSLGVIALRAVYQKTARAQDQALFVLIGYAVMFASCMCVRLVRSWERLCAYAMPACIVLLLLPFALGSPSANAASWVRVAGVQFQPSEFVKPALVVILASGFSDKRGFATWWKYAAFGAFCCVILFFQPDLGAMFLYFLITLGMFYAGTGRGKLTLAILGAAVAGAFVFLQLLDKVKQFRYLAERIAIWKNPWNSAYENARQIVQGLISIASGGWFGSGLGLGSADRVAVVGSDYIFAEISEEFGIVFALCVLLIFICVIARGASVAMNARTRFHSLIAFGCVFALAAQMLLIVCGNLHLIPLTGVTLPFVSDGGSSLVACMACAGLILGVSSVNAHDEYDDLVRLAGGEWRDDA